MYRVNWVRNRKQGSGLDRGTTCVKVQRQDSMVRLITGRSLTADSYMFFKYVLSPYGAVPSYSKRLASSYCSLKITMPLLSGFIILSFIWIVIFCVYLSFLLKTHKFLEGRGTMSDSALRQQLVNTATIPFYRQMKADIFSAQN